MRAETPVSFPLVVLLTAVTLPYYVWSHLMRGCARTIFKGGAEVLYDR
jgi:hypothetical protein